jgi:thiol-disulfide isomerase/thioredoxin
VWALWPYTLLEELAKEFTSVVISKINVDKKSRVDKRSIPALLYFKNGEIVDTQTEYRANP